MTFTFTPAKREGVSLLLGMVGGTGSGKTYTAMRTASGICRAINPAAPPPFAVIDTEAGRAKHYADQFRFDHGDLSGPFRPDAYTAAILAADKAGYPVIVVDSMSHVWAGDGGILDWQEEELTRMAGTDYGKREACKMAAWIKPKVSHKHMVQKLLQVRAHLILCFRAEEKIEMVKENGKTVIKQKQSLTGSQGWIPVCEKNLPFELTTSFLFTADAPGIPKPIKLQQQHRALFPLDRVVDEESGRKIAEWAAGTPSAPIDGKKLAEHGKKLEGAAKSEWWRGLSAAEQAAVREVSPPPAKSDAPATVAADSGKAVSKYDKWLAELKPDCDIESVMQSAKDDGLSAPLLAKLREAAKERGL